MFDRTVAIYCVGLTCHLSWRHTLRQNTKPVLLEAVTRNWRAPRLPVMCSRWTQDTCIWQIRINRRVTLVPYHCSNVWCALLVIFGISFWYEALTAVTVKIIAFWYVTPCHSLELFSCSGRTCGLHIQECHRTWRYVSEYGSIPSCRP
jgi:hypothetical protein